MKAVATRSSRGGEQETGQRWTGRQLSDASELEGFTRRVGRSMADGDRRAANGRSRGVGQEAVLDQRPMNRLADDPVSTRREMNGIESDRTIAQVEAGAARRAQRRQEIDDGD